MYTSVCSNHNILGFNAKIQIIFGTVCGNNFKIKSILNSETFVELCEDLRKTESIRNVFLGFIHENSVILPAV